MAKTHQHMMLKQRETLVVVFPFSVYSKDEMNKELICLQVKSLENHDVNHCQKIIILNKAVFEFHNWTQQMSIKLYSIFWICISELGVPISELKSSDVRPFEFGFFELFLTNFKVQSRATKAIAVRTPVFGNPNSKVRIFALWSSSPCLQAKQELLHPNMWIVRVRLTSSDANHEGAHESRCQSSEFRSFWRFGFQFLKFAFLTLKFGSVRAFGARIPNFGIRISKWWRRRQRRRRRRRRRYGHTFCLYCALVLELDRNAMNCYQQPVNNKMSIL